MAWHYLETHADDGYKTVGFFDTINCPNGETYIQCIEGHGKPQFIFDPELSTQLQTEFQPLFNHDGTEEVLIEPQRVYDIADMMSAEANRLLGDAIKKQHPIIYTKGEPPLAGKTAIEKFVHFFGIEPMPSVKFLELDKNAIGAFFAQCIASQICKVLVRNN